MKPRDFFLLLSKRGEFIALLITVLMIIGFTATTDGVWLSMTNLREVLRVTAVLSIIAIGQSLVMTVGEIDISVGSVFGVAGIIYLALAPEYGVLGAVQIVILTGMLIGAINGWIVASFGIPSLIVSLGGLFLYRGLAVALVSEGAYSVDAETRASAPLYQTFGDAALLDVNNAWVWALLVLLVAMYVVRLTPVGNRLLGMGGSAPSAHSRGVDIFKIKWGVFIACSTLAALAAILESSNLAYVDGSFGRQRELSAIAAAVLGGTALTGGRISLVGAVLGAFILSGIQSYLVIQAISPQWFALLLGFIIVAVSLADRGLNAILRKLAER